MLRRGQSFRPIRNGGSMHSKGRRIFEGYRHEPCYLVSALGPPSKGGPASQPSLFLLLLDLVVPFWKPHHRRNLRPHGSGTNGPAQDGW